MIWFALAVAVPWGLCALYVYGRYVAYFWHEFPSLQSDEVWQRNTRRARYFALAGPLAIPAATIKGGGFKHGLMYRRRPAP